MRCPHCGSAGTHKRIDTRRHPSEIRRRRQCGRCGRRFNTSEEPLVTVRASRVVHKGGR